MKVILIVLAIIVAVLVVMQLALAAKFGAQINAVRGGRMDPAGRRVRLLAGEIVSASPAD